MNHAPDIILYVDDEEQALKYFRLAFAKDYQVLTAASAAEAWSLLKIEGERISIVISDQRMPGKTGIELLEDIKECYPRTLRLLTTAYADLSSAIAAVNRGAVYAYVNKPWNVEELHLILRRAFDFLHLQRERDLLLVEKIGVYHQLLFIDRLRSLGLLASACAGRIRHPLSGAAAFWRDRCAHFAEIPATSRQVPDLWSEMIALTRQLIEDGRHLGAWLTRHGPGSRPGMMDGAALAAHLLNALPALRLDDAMGSSRPSPTARAAESASPLFEQRPLATGLESFIGWLLEMAGGQAAKATARLAVVVTDHDLDLSLTIAGEGRPPGSPSTDLAGLCAYLAIYHYGGSITISSWGPTGGIIRIRLSSTPSSQSDDDGLDDFLNALSALEPLPLA